jgi:hypothetical protein
MRELLKIGLWFSIFILVFVLIPLVTTLADPTLTLPKNDWAWHLADFNRRIVAYKTNREPKTVIIGASYTEYLGESEKFVNLGMTGTKISEHIEVLKAVRPTDKPVYLFSARELIYRKVPARPVICDPVSRCNYIAKAIIRPSPQPVDIRAADLRKQQISFLNSRTLKAKDLEPLHQMYALRPDTVFVLSPILIDCDAVDEVHSNFENILADSGLPFINLSRSVPNDQFIDILHVEEGRRGSIIELLLASEI